MAKDGLIEVRLAMKSLPRSYLKAAMDKVLKDSAAELTRELKSFPPLAPGWLASPAYPFGTLIGRGSIVSMYVGRSSPYTHEAVRIRAGMLEPGVIDQIDDDVIQFWKEVT